MAVVTGANGFVGSWACRALAAAGMQVRALGRGEPSALPSAVSYHRADLLDARALGAALDGADTVVHLAARVHVMRESAGDPLGEFRRVNVEGTRILLDQAVRAGATRVVFASTVKAVGEGGATLLTDQTIPAPDDPYGVSKLEAEDVVRSTADRHALEATILRFPLIYGPGMKGNMLRLFRLVDRGVPLPLGLVRNRRSMAFVGNAVAAMLAVLRVPADRSRVFFVSDARDVSTPELLRLIGGALGRRVRLLPVPAPVFRVAGRMGDVLSRVRPVPLTSRVVDRLLGSLAVDVSPLARATGFHPPYTLEEGLRITAEWYRGRQGTGT